MRKKPERRLKPKKATDAFLNCKKFSICSAPICPLDPDWRQHLWIKDEKVCRYIKKAVRRSVWGEYPELWDPRVVGAILSKYPRMLHQISGKDICET